MSTTIGDEERNIIFNTFKFVKNRKQRMKELKKNRIEGIDYKDARKVYKSMKRETASSHSTSTNEVPQKPPRNNRRYTEEEKATIMTIFNTYKSNDERMAAFALIPAFSDRLFTSLKQQYSIMKRTQAAFQSMSQLDISGVKRKVDEFMQSPNSQEEVNSVDDHHKRPKTDGNDSDGNDPLEHTGDIIDDNEPVAPVPPPSSPVDNVVVTEQVVEQTVDFYLDEIPDLDLFGDDDAKVPSQEPVTGAIGDGSSQNESQVAEPEDPFLTEFDPTKPVLDMDDLFDI